MTAAFWTYPLGPTTGELLTDAQARANETHTIHGLDPAAPLTVTETQRTAGTLVQTIVTSGGTTTVSRQ